jgi:hypothetical protein
MKFILSICFCFLVSVNVKAQADFVELGSQQYDLLERLEIKLQSDSVLNFSAIKPYDRQTVAKRLAYINMLSNTGKISLSAVDKHNLSLAIKDNFDWKENLSDTSLRFANLFKKVHANNPFYFGVKRGDFSFYSHLMYNFQFGKDNNQTAKIYNNSRGIIHWRGQFTKKLGYYSYVTDNQMRTPTYVQDYIIKNNAVPGLGYFKGNVAPGSTDPLDLYEVKGGVQYNAAKGIDLQFAFDKAFIGNGYRSLILSDFSNNFLFFKANFRFWKINYYTMFAQMVDKGAIRGDTLYPSKFMTFHYLDLQATKWLNIGLYENIMFSRPNNSFDPNYLNPMIFYAAFQSQLGSPDKTTIGINFKANIHKKYQLYGQAVINEFVSKEVVRYSDGWWGNKHAFQLGIKAIDVLGIKNLDIQLETNIVRPFVYTHNKSGGAYTHYNQALAHPLGANFKEYIAIIKYQPIPKLALQAKLISYTQGLDSAGKNMGSDVNQLYTTRPTEYGWFIGRGIDAKCLIAHVSATYEIMPNIFIDADYIIRNYKKEGALDVNSNIFNVGFRMNLRKRVYDF